MSTTSLWRTWSSLISERPFGCCSWRALSQSLSISLCFFYLSLISERPFGCFSIRALSLSFSLSASFICLLFQRDPVAASPYGPCLCLSLSLLLLSVSYFKETLWLLLHTGPVSISISFCYLSLVSERPCGCCSSMPLSPSFHHMSLSKRLYDLWALSLSPSPSVICLLFQRDLVAAVPLWGKEETDHKLSQ